MKKLPWLKIVPIAVLMALIGFTLYSVTFLFADDGTVDAKEILAKVESGEDVYYNNIKITGVLDFTKLAENSKLSYNESESKIRIEVPSSITIINSTIENGIIASGTRNGKSVVISFKKNFTLSRSLVKGVVTFTGSTIHGSVYCNSMVFTSNVSFEGASFLSNDILFSESAFKGEANFQGATFSGTPTFLKTSFEQLAAFQNATFLSDAQFGATTFYNYADFSLLKVSGAFLAGTSSFLGKAVFTTARFKDRADFYSVEFQNTADFSRSIFTGALRFENAKFDSTLTLDETTFYSGKPNMTNIEAPYKNLFSTAGSTTITVTAFTLN